MNREELLGTYSEMRTYRESCSDSAHLIERKTEAWSTYSTGAWTGSLPGESQFCVLARVVTLTERKAPAAI